MKDSRVQLRHLRHTLITWTCSVCPEYEAMYRRTTQVVQSSPSSLSSCLPSCKPWTTRIQVSLSRSRCCCLLADKELLRQAKGCAELTANTPIVDEVVGSPLSSRVRLTLLLLQVLPHVLLAVRSRPALPPDHHFPAPVIRCDRSELGLTTLLQMLHQETGHEDGPRLDGLLAPGRSSGSARNGFRCRLCKPVSCSQLLLNLPARF
eukprot:768630-Hanusia_phi.AAC.7